MKRSIMVILLLALVISGAALAHTSKKKHTHSGANPQGGGYHDGEYHLRKAGEPKKKLFRWDGYDSPIKGMKESSKKPPSKYPSQSPDQ